jgi:hypothetical protein
MPNSINQDLLNPYEFHEEALYIACVGENGGTDDETIRHGFKDTVSLLMHEISLKHTEDIYVYPLIYCARHSVELGLKIIIRYLLDIYSSKGEKVIHKIDLDKCERVMLKHDIEALSNLIIECYIIDNRLIGEYDKIAPLLSDYYIDPDGDAFKYEFSADKIPHMISRGIRSIDLDLFHNRFQELSQGIDGLVSQISRLSVEYQQNTFTKRLSRRQIYEISKALLDRDLWDQPAFDEIKNAIKKSYGIGSKEFSEALNLIQRHREFSANINHEIPFGNLSDDCLSGLASLAKGVKAFSEGDTYIRLNDIKAGLKRSQELTKIRKSKSVKISDENIPIILTFLELGKSDYYSETLDNIYKFYQNEEYINRTWAISKISSEQNFKFILNGMKKAGQTTYCRKLASYM